LKPKGKIVIDQEYCKSCGFCIEHCPKKLIVLATSYNEAGYYPALFQEGECTGCAICALVCPEACIEVERE
jgi:2-oxoglutarate ferredoxin oxidoreductase subunit delta